MEEKQESNNKRQKTGKDSKSKERSKFLDRSVEVNLEEAILLQDTFENDILLQTIYNTFCFYIFTNGFKIKKKEKNGLYNEDNLNEIWGDFFFDAFQHIIIFGYVVYVINVVEDAAYDEKSNMWRPCYRPRVVPRAFYSLKQTIGENFEPSWEVKDLRSPIYSNNAFAFNLTDNDGSHNENEDNNIKFHIYVHPMKGPDQTSGMHRSHVANCLIEMRRKFLLDQLCLIGVSQQCLPTVLIERPSALYDQKQQKQSTDTTGIQLPDTSLSVLADLDTDLTNNNGNISYNGGQDVNDSEAVSIGYGLTTNSTLKQKRIPGLDDRSSMSRGNQMITLSQTIKENVGIIKKGFTLSSSQPAPGKVPDEYSYMMESHRQTILVLFGIPVGLMFPTSGPNSRTSNNIDDEELRKFSNTIAGFRKIMVQIFIEVYENVFNVSVRQSGIEVDLPSMPNVNMTQLFHLSSQNIIPFEYMKGLCVDIVGISREHMLKEGEKNENDRPPIGGNENWTAPLMAAKKHVIEAEAKEREASASLKKEEKAYMGKEVDAQVGKLKAEAKSIKEGKNESSNNS